MIAAPFAGALADRYRFQLFLFFAVLALAASTALTGATSLVVLYGLRAVAGLAFGAIVPLCLLVGHQVACDPHEKAGLLRC
jgi:MFS family permease